MSRPDPVCAISCQDQTAFPHFHPRVRIPGRARVLRRSFSSFQLPQPHGLVRRPRGQHRSVWREGHAIHCFWNVLPACAGRFHRTPATAARVCPPTPRPASIRPARAGHAKRKTGMSFQRAQGCSIGHPPQPHGLVPRRPRPASIVGEKATLVTIACPSNVRRSFPSDTRHSRTVLSFAPEASIDSVRREGHAKHNTGMSFQRAEGRLHRTPATAARCSRWPWRPASIRPARRPR